MSIQEQLTEASAIVDSLSATRRGRAFVTGVERFVAHLSAIPDNGIAEMTEAALATASREADRIVERIEQRIASGGDSDAIKQRLATGIYDVRRTLEECERWFRHYHPAG